MNKSVARDAFELLAQNLIADQGVLVAKIEPRHLANDDVAHVSDVCQVVTRSSLRRDCFSFLCEIDKISLLTNLLALQQCADMNGSCGRNR